MIEQYERELYRINIESMVLKTMNDLFFLNNIPIISNEAMSYIKPKLNKDVVELTSFEGSYSSFISKIVAFIKKIGTAIFRFVYKLFVSDSADIDKQVRKIKSKLPRAIDKIDMWVADSINNATTAAVEVSKNRMLFKILSSSEVGYLNWLSSTSHLESCGEFLSSYKNVANYLSDSTKSIYRELYTSIRLLKGVSVEGTAPSFNELLFPINISGDKISFMVLSLYTKGDTIMLSKPRIVSLVYNDDSSYHDKSTLSSSILHITSEYDMISPIKHIIGERNVTDDEIVSAVEKVAFFFMRGTDDKKTQNNIAGFLSTLTEACSMSVRNHMNNLNSINMVLGELIDYKEK